MRFEWEAGKNRGNVAKHKVSFETAISVFDDPNALSIPDRIVDGEERWQTLGMIVGLILIVAHTWRDEDGEESDSRDFGPKGDPNREASICKKPTACEPVKFAL